MRASTPTKLPLDRFARIVGLNPLHANRISLPALNRTVCAQGLAQHDWQTADRLSVEDIARCIARAEEQIEALVGYRLLPSWEVDERVAAPRPGYADASYFGGPDLRGRFKAVSLRWKHFISGGIRKSVAIDEESVITWDAADASDGWKSFGEVTCAVPDGVTDPCQLHVYYPGKSGKPEWEIRPLESATISSGVATIRFRRELCVLEELQEQRASDVDLIDGLVDANFLEEVDIYRVYNDPSQQVSFLWDPPACACANADDVYHDRYLTQTGFLLGRDDRLSHVGYAAGNWDLDTVRFVPASWTQCMGEPDQLRTWYLAGYRDMGKDCPMVDMDDRLARIVAYYAASMFERPPCSCQEGHFDTWMHDLAFSRGQDEDSSYTLNARDLGSPLGTRRGAIEAWRQICATGLAVNPVGAVV